MDTIYAPCGCSPLGKLTQSSRPHTPAGTVYWTVNTYDASGRTTRVTLPDGSHTDYAYQGNTVTVTDPAGKWKKFTLDALGNLTIVQEPDPTFGTVSTNYTYDILNHLTNVSMPRGANTQTRTFVYNTGNTVGAFLLSATNPETGTVNYTYSNGLLASKTDAKNQQFTYQYDTYHRLTQISVGGNVLRTFMYDSNSLDGAFSTYTAGRLVAVQHSQFGFNSGANQGPTNIQFTEMLSYTQAGQPNKKRLQVNETLPSPWPAKTLNLDAAYSYDNEGKMLSVNYPTTYGWNGTSLVPTAGPTYTYSFDSMSRPVTLTDQSSFVAVNNVQYNAANQMSTINYFTFAETRSYNTLGQMTNLNSITYNYPSASNNNGKISSQVISGETITYQYDSLNRLLSATSNAGWSDTYGYDGFGNLVSKTPTGGAPQLSIAVNAANNRIVGLTYDANGNQTMTSFGGVTYDAENRIVIGPGVQYFYDSGNKRIWRATFDANQNLTGQEIYFYGVDGQKLGTYSIFMDYGAGHPVYMGDAMSNLAVYFGAKRVGTIDQSGIQYPFTPDRLGSKGTYYPYGEDKGTPLPNDQVKFATYTRDSATGLDYADQRYFSSQYGRFTSPDPYKASGGPGDPASWNRYTYTRGDPVNRYDPSGLEDELAFGFSSVLPVLTNSASGGILPSSPFGDPGETSQQMLLLVFNHPGGGVAQDPKTAARTRLNKITKDFNPTGKCKDFLNELAGSMKNPVDVDTLINEIKEQAGRSADQIYDGNDPGAFGVELTQEKFGDESSRTGQSNVGGWFKSSGSNGIALSQVNGDAIFLNMGLSFGSSYGMGILLHEILHKQSIGDGSSHGYIGAALDAVGAPGRILGQADTFGSQIGQICFK